MPSHTPGSPPALQAAKNLDGGPVARGHRKPRSSLTLHIIVQVPGGVLRLYGLFPAAP